MGVFATKPFERNDDIEGQGKSVLLLAKRLMITKYELDRIYHEFRKHEDPKTDLIDIAELFMKFKLPYSVFFSVLFQLYDINKTGMFNFQEYLIMMWAFLSASDDNLSALCFNLFDLERYGTIDVNEAKYLVNFMWDFKMSRSATKATALMDQNIDSVISLQEFILLCRHHPVLLKPLRKVQADLRKKTVFTRFWKQVTRRRNRNLGVKSIIELRALDGHKILAISMEYLNLRKDVVPRHFVEQWRLVQKKKALSYKGHIELPAELLEKLTQQQQNEDGNGNNLEIWSNSNEQMTMSFEEASYIP